MTAIRFFYGIDAEEANGIDTEIVKVSIRHKGLSLCERNVHKNTTSTASHYALMNLAIMG